MAGSAGPRLNNAELAFHLFLPGTISLSQAALDDAHFAAAAAVDGEPRAGSSSVLSRLIAIRRSAVPVNMNGDYRPCRGRCRPGEKKEKEANHAIHVLSGGRLVLLERHFTRRHRYMVVANMADGALGLAGVAKLYSGGEVVLDTADTERAAGEVVKFKDATLEGRQAFVIKFPK